MPIRIGEVLLWCFAAWLVCVAFRKKPRSRDSSCSPPDSREKPLVATVLAEETSSMGGRSTPESKPDHVGAAEEPTGRTARVAGRGALFECVEFRSGGTLHTRVCRIDHRGKPVSPWVVYREPFEQVTASFTTVAA